MVSKSDYYVFRKGHVRPDLEFEDVRRLITEACVAYEQGGWFQKHLGKDCVDNRKDIGAYVLEELGQEIWPPRGLGDLDEDWLFTALEFLSRNVAKPTKTHVHPWNECGIHVDASDSDEGRSEFRERINGILGRYVTPFELRKNGEVWHVAPTGLEDLAVVETGDPSIDERVAIASSRYRRHGSSDNEKRQAVRDLADVLEYLRSSMGTGLPEKDEGYLFDIANNFGIRHHNPKQKTEYNQGIYLDWIFYAFLNAIALAVKVIGESEGK